MAIAARCIYPTQFVRHFMRRHDGALPTTAAIRHRRPSSWRMANLLAPEGLDRERGIQFLIQDELRAIIPQGQDCTPERVKAAMEFLCDEWLVDVSTDQVGKSLLIAAALTLIERSLMPERPCFFVTAGRRGNGKTTTIIMLIWPSQKGRQPPHGRPTRKNGKQRWLLIQGVPYILWDNIPRGMQITCPHIERSCTVGVLLRSQARRQRDCTAASTIHFFTGNNIGAKGDMASRSIHIRLDVDRADPENREFTHPDPIGWAENHRAEIMAALYTILLGNTQLKAPRDAEGKTRFKLWWRLVGSAVRTRPSRWVGARFREIVRHARRGRRGIGVFRRRARGPGQAMAEPVHCNDIAGMINNPDPDEDEQTLREFLLPGALPKHVFSAKSIGKLLKQHLDEPVRSGERTLVLRSWEDKHIKLRVYGVRTITTT